MSAGGPDRDSFKANVSGATLSACCTSPLPQDMSYLQVAKPPADHRRLTRVDAVNAALASSGMDYQVGPDGKPDMTAFSRAARSRCSKVIAKLAEDPPWPSRSRSHPSATEAPQSE